MVKIVMSTVTMAMVSADDLASLLQMSKQSEDAICVQVAAGDVAPVSGSFTATGQAAVVVAAGSVASETGSFCYAKQDALLMQRTIDSNTDHGLEAAVALKGWSAPDAQASQDYNEHENHLCVIPANEDGSPRDLFSSEHMSPTQCRNKCDTDTRCLSFGYGKKAGESNYVCDLSSSAKCLLNTGYDGGALHRQTSGYVGSWYCNKKDALMAHKSEVILANGKHFRWSHQEMNRNCRSSCAEIYTSSTEEQLSCIARYQCRD
jgi:hypothetical protein